MWICIEVEDQSDIGKNEKRRLLSVGVKITQSILLGPSLRLVADCYEVHPATLDSKPIRR